MKEVAPRTLVLPPSDCAYWRAPQGSSGPLLYLAWGSRHFGLSPIPERRHDGWSFVVIEAGNPTLLCRGRSEPTGELEVLLIGPDCPFGWRDEPGRTCKLLVWMWDATVHPMLQPLSRDACLRQTISAGDREELRRMHALTRGEIHRGDAHSRAALGALRVLLEIQIVRFGENAPADPRREMIERAGQWIGANLATRQPLTRLSDFLGVSTATVRRLFREQLGTTVMAKISEMRCREAERMLLAEGASIKEVAYRLGYRHPSDFSRAYRRGAGQLPSLHKVRLD